MGKRITVIGGDIRQITVAECLAKDGFNVAVYGFDKAHIPPNLTFSDNLADAIGDSKTVVLGITPCEEHMNISTPYFKGQISAFSLLSHLQPGSTIIGGKLSADFAELCRQSDIISVDYVNREDFAVLNAVPTAEGALAIAMDQLPFTIHGADCLITGFGRIGKILARNLHLLGANVTCTARKSADIAWIDSLCYTSAPTSSIKSIVHDFAVIFNTVPQPIFDRDVLRNVRTDALIIDLASKPGGVDFETASRLGIKAIHALSLPGKCAPVTAGKIIKDTIVNILSEI